MSCVNRSGTSESLAQALALIDQKLPCFPCRVNKSPATSHGFKDATCDRDTLRELWKRHDGPLVGVATGDTSGLDVVDIDPRHGGAAWFTEHRHQLPPTRVHRTRSGGLHLILHHESGMRCSAGKIAAGVDVRAIGGYVIWWPAAGLPVCSEMPVAPWPEWLVEQLSFATRPASSRITVPDRHALTRLVQLIAGAREGDRNGLTYWAACRAGEMVASGMLAAEAAVAVIAEAATRAGLPRKEAERTAWSGVRTTGGRARA